MSAAPKRWNEISAYLDEALSLTEEERVAWLADLRGRDAPLAGELESLLDEHRALSEEGFLEQPPVTIPGPTPLGGQTIGPYTLTAPIGHGGMSTVWAAERADGRFRGRVAIKFLNFALHGPVGQSRFAREGSILGRLAHPHIARLMDAGVSSAGQPYLVLEFVQGEPIDRYCEQNRLDVEARLRLFLDVLSAVEHAHANLIVHRDLKPSNVLVTKDGQVRLLDFGIAKLLDDEEYSATLLTREGAGAFTPQYAAPEQLTGGNITTATDVYSLGVLLYLLLTGEHPAGRAQSTAELVRAITTTEPRRMSEVVTGRPEEGEKLRRLLRGDLDTIVSKALKKQPEERYASAVALADDVRRYLNHQPLSARPDTLAYRSAKFVRRNRTAVALVAVAALAIVAGVAGTWVQAARARRERDFAFRQLSRAEAINDLQSYVMSDAAPSGKPLPVTELLRRAEQIVQRQGGDLDTRVGQLISIGAEYKAADDYHKAQQLLEQAHTLSKSAAEPSLRSSSACLLAQIVSRGGDSARAEALWKEGLAALPDDPLYAIERVYCWLRASEVAINANRPADAVTRALKAREWLTHSPIHSDFEELGSMIVLASAYNDAGDRGQALAMYELAAGRMKVLGRDHTEQASGMFNNWAVTLLRAGQPLQAESVFRRTIEIDRDTPQHDSLTPMSLSNYGATLYQLGRFDEAANYAERAYTGASASGDAMAADQALLHRARIYRAQGNLTRSNEMLSEARPRMERKFRPGTLPLIVLTSETALNAQAAGDLKTAGKLFDSAVNDMEAMAGAGHTSPEFEGRILTYRADLKLQLGLADQALADAQRALSMSQQAAVPGGHSADVGHAYLMIGKALRALGRRQESDQYLRTATQNLEDTLGKDHPLSVEAARLAEAPPRP